MIFELHDSTETVAAPRDLAQNRVARDQAGLEEALADAFLKSNEDRFRQLHVDAFVRRTGGCPELVLRAGIHVGAAPLRSPTTGRDDHGLIVRPRFGWSCIGDSLAATGFTIVPRLLALPALPRSERRVPAWVLSSVVLARLDAMLRAMRRRFADVDALRQAPRGRIDWHRYACRELPRGRADSVPCRFPDLIDDQELRGAIHHVLRLQLASLAGQRGHGVIVRRLMALCDRMLTSVADAAPRVPSAAAFAAWLRQPLGSHTLIDGLEAMSWTIHETGLAGSADLTGLPWRLNMAEFFEAWVEAVARELGRQHMYSARSGRLEQTRVPLHWEPRFDGSQRSLVPDIVLERDDVVLVLDAKYKSHRADLDAASWDAFTDAAREVHRHDLLQALAYTTLFPHRRVVGCLAYPFPQAAFADLHRRGRALVRSRVPCGDRTVELALAALPLGGSLKSSAELLAPLLTTPMT